VSTSPQAALESLGRRLVQQGYRFRAQSVFSPSGIFVYSAPPSDDQKLAVMEHCVFLYATDSEWEARVTQHGGSQWACRAGSIAVLEEVALSALQTVKRPPSASWHLL
jgi:hypothetical protein